MSLNRVHQCKLDIYLPNNTNKGLPIIVWFHGGGLTGGTKAIPEELKNDQFIMSYYRKA